MSEFEQPMSIEEVNDSFEMKITKRYIINEYPFIKNLTAMSGNKYYITLKVTFDPYEFASLHEGMYVSWFIKCGEKRGETLSLGTYFSNTPDYYEVPLRDKRIDGIVNEFSNELDHRLKYFHNFIVPEDKRVYAKFIAWTWDCVDEKGVGNDPTDVMMKHFTRDKKT